MDLENREPQPPSEGRHPAETMAHVIYFLYALGLFFALTPLVGVALAHVKANDAMPEGLRTHYRGLIRTFWWPLLLGAVSFLVTLTIVGAWLGLLGVIAAAVWYLYRIIRGWLFLNRQQPLPDPEGLF